MLIPLPWVTLLLTLGALGRASGDLCVVGHTNATAGLPAQMWRLSTENQSSLYRWALGRSRLPPPAPTPTPSPRRSQLPAPLTVVHRPDTAVLGDYVYFFGSGISPACQNAPQRFSMQKQAWEALPAMPVCTHGAAIAVAASKIFVLGGSNAQATASTTALAWDPHANSNVGAWGSVTQLPHGSAFGCAAHDAAGSSVILAGGFDGNFVLDTVTRFVLDQNSPQNYTWVAGTPLPYAVYDAGCATSADGLYMFLVGGRTSFQGGDTANVIMVNMTDLMSQIFAPMQLAQARHSLAVTPEAGSLYAVGGSFPGGGSNQVLKFNAPNPQWSLVSTLSDTNMSSYLSAMPCFSTEDDPTASFCKAVPNACPGTSATQCAGEHTCDLCCANLSLRPLHPSVSCLYREGRGEWSGSTKCFPVCQGSPTPHLNTSYHRLNEAAGVDTACQDEFAGTSCQVVCDNGYIPSEPTVQCSDWAEPSCTDTLGWVNARGDDCTTYEQQGWCVNGTAGPSWATLNKNNGATDNCCVCGKGSAQASPLPQQCSDSPAWTNPQGQNCTVYEPNGWCINGTSAAGWAEVNAGTGATSNCCVCGKDANTSPSIVPPAVAPLIGLMYSSAKCVPAPPDEASCPVSPLIENQNPSMGSCAESKSGWWCQVACENDAYVPSHPRVYCRNGTWMPTNVTCTSIQLPDQPAVLLIKDENHWPVVAIVTVVSMVVYCGIMAAAFACLGTYWAYSGDGPKNIRASLEGDPSARMQSALDDSQEMAPLRSPLLSSPPQCSTCTVTAAVVHCWNCQDDLCDTCDKCTHANPALAGHTRTSNLQPHKATAHDNYHEDPTVTSLGGCHDATSARRLTVASGSGALVQNDTDPLQGPSYHLSKTLDVALPASVGEALYKAFVDTAPVTSGAITVHADAHRLPTETFLLHFEWDERGYIYYILLKDEEATCGLQPQ
eukprot:gene11545-2100_t